jgi:hypothetical protein
MPEAGNEYERHQIESLLQSKQIATARGVGLLLSPVDDRGYTIQTAAVFPAMQANGINLQQIVRVFGSESFLDQVYDSVQSAEIIVADVSDANADLMYVLGLCHGLRRCPILIATQTTELPFNLDALRCVRFEMSADGIFRLREQLERAIRVHLSASRPKDPPAVR